jgi:hypothetical protein
MAIVKAPRRFPALRTKIRIRNLATLILFTLLTTSAVVLFWAHNTDIQPILSTQVTYTEKTSVDLNAHLPCVTEFKQRILDDPLLSNGTKEELLDNISSLTYGNRNKWISRLNPVIIQDQRHLFKVRSVCHLGRIALVTITSGLSNNIQEWLFYHLLLGVQHIILLDDSVPGSFEQRSLHKAIQIFVEHGYVIHRLLEHLESDSVFSGTQNRIYNQALREFQNHYDWIGFIDHDEFVTLHQDKCLPSFLSNYTEFGGVVLQWRMLGFTNVSVHDMTRTHFEQYEDISAYNRLIKSFVQPKYTEKMDVHEGFYKEEKKWAVNFRKETVTGHFNVLEGTEPEAFAVAELRHFYMGDLQHALYEKVCGLNDERVFNRNTRFIMFQDVLHRNNERKEIDFRFPLIHDDFKSLFFQNQ